MEAFTPDELKTLYHPERASHKGQNGKLLLIGGSHLFHAASLWALTIASRIVDMVFYASIPENNQIVQEAKGEFRNGIVIPRADLENYLAEADCILLGPGMLRAEHELSDFKFQIANLSELANFTNEGEQTYVLTKYLLAKFPEKKWVLDAGALQMLEPEWLRPLAGRVILTPHQKEFTRVFGKTATAEHIAEVAKQYNCILLVKGEEDTVCSPEGCVKVAGGNAGMTKGGTGDVLAGLTASLACKNELFIAAKAASYINKKAGEELAKTVGIFFNASDVAATIPAVMHGLGL